MNSHLLIYCLVLNVLELMAQTEYRCELERICNEERVGQSNFFLNDIIVAFSPVTLQCQCTQPQCTGGVTWMFDRDASGNQNIAINTSSSKYEVPSESDTCLTITSAIGEDSGLYKCFYSAEPGVVMRTICVIVVGQARFAECPDGSEHLGHCTQVTPILEEQGNNIIFNTRIAFNGTGSCHNQHVVRMGLFRGNMAQNSILTCNEGSNRVTECSGDERLEPTSNAGNFDFDLMLRNTYVNDSGMYVLKVEVVEDETPVNSIRVFNKSFYVNITERPVTTSAVTTDGPATVETTGTIESPQTDRTGSGSNKVAVGVGVGVGIVAILLLVAAIIAVVLYIVPQYRKESKSDNKSPNKIWYRNQKSQEVPLTRDEFFSNKHRTGTGNDSNRLSVATGDIELELDTQLNSEHAQVKLHGVEDNGTI